MWIIWGKSGRKKTVKLDRFSAGQIMMAVEPMLGNKTCLECGGYVDLGVSPPDISHGPTCRGVERSRIVEEILRSLA